MPSSVRTVPPKGEGVRKRSIADKLAQSAQLIRLRGPLAFRRSAAALAPASERQDSAQAALHAKHDAKALPPLRKSRLSEAPRAPVVMPAGTMPGPPGSGVTSPARRNRTCSINWLSPVDVPDVSETARLWSSRRGSQRPCICADESGPFTHRGFRQLARTTLTSFPILIVMAGLVPAIHVLASAIKKTWMPGIKPGMTGVAYFVIAGKGAQGRLDAKRSGNPCRLERVQHGPPGQARW